MDNMECLTTPGEGSGEMTEPEKGLIDGAGVMDWVDQL